MGGGFRRLFLVKITAERRLTLSRLQDGAF